MLRIKHGDEVRVRLINRLEVPLSLHWHGVRIANAMDGAAGLTQAPVQRDGSFDYRFTPPDSGTYLYQAAMPGEQPGRFAAGLYGLLIVEERQQPAVEAEFALAATSLRLDTAGHAVEMAAGRALLATGRARAETATVLRGARVRLRVANAAHATLMHLGVEGAQPTIIAIDSQPCEPFAPARGRVPIGPGARFDVMLDMPRLAGASVKVTLVDLAYIDAVARTVLDLRTSENAAAEHSAPIGLPANPRLPVAIALERAARAEILLRPLSTAAAGQIPPRLARMPRTVLSSHLDTDRPVLTVNRGAPVSLALVNPSEQPMSVHIHGHTMRVLHDLDDGWHPYWRDTVLVEPRRTHHVAFIADNPGKWLIAAQPIGVPSSPADLCAWFEVRR